MSSRELSSRLHALIDESFPRTCGKCGRAFDDLDHFFRETRHLQGAGAGGRFFDDDGTPLVLVSRNCACGSTLMGIFGDRRDRSAAGERRRREFDELVDLLVETGLGREVARAELRKVIRGEGSDVLERIERAGANRS